MGKPPKRRIQSSRLTPKGTVPAGANRDPITRTGGSKRGPSPWWVPALLFGFIGLGGLVIIINYLGYVPGGDASNVYLLLGLGFILAGMVTATQLH